MDTVSTTYLGLLSLLLQVIICAGIPQIEINFSILEESHLSGALVRNLKLDPTIRSRFSEQDFDEIYFQYLSEKPEGFTVSSAGAIRTDDVIDRDVICPNQETCSVMFDLAIQPVTFFTLVKVTIEIRDTNDHSPTFDGGQLSLTLAESTPPGNIYLLPKVTDPDSPAFSVVSLYLQGGGDYFEIKSTIKPDGSQETRLILKTALDRETSQDYQLQVLATDGGDPPRSGSLDIHISVTDANDNHPVFDQDTYEVTIPENAPSGFIVTTVQATDLDTGLNGHVVYRMSTDTAASLGHVFNVHNQTGEITVTGQVDYEEAAILYLTIEAYDRGADPVPGETVVIVHVQDINDHAPEITVHTLGGPGIQETTVQEGTQDGTFVARVVVTDKDHNNNGKYNCTLREEHFLLGPLGSDYLVTTQGDIDRETESEYHLEIACRDFGSQPLSTSIQITVRIQDINDHAPYFSQPTYHKDIEENNIPGLELLQVSASDPDEGLNSELVYSIQGQENQWFEVDPVTGIVKVKVPLDREFQSRYEINIIAADKGNPSNSGTTVLVLNVIDLNDEAPKFTQDVYTFGIYENEVVGTEVGFVQAEYSDGEPYNMYTFALLSIEQGQTDGLFRITPDTGRISTTRSLDREFQSVYSVVAVAVDTSEPYFSSTATVSIYVMDRNDNPPRFTFPSQYNNTIWISNDIPVGYIVTRVQADDKDGDNNGQIRYELLGNGNNVGVFFSLDPFLGTLTLTSPLRHLDNFTFSISIIASDSGDVAMSTSTSLHIIVNKTLSSVATITQDGGIMSNVTIVIAVACLSGILIVGLLLAIVILLRQRRLCANRQWRQKCRMNTLRVLTATQTVDTSQEIQSGNTQESKTEQSPVPSNNSRYVSAQSQYSNNSHTKTTNLNISLEKSRQWLDNLKTTNEKIEKSPHTDKEVDSVSVESGPGSNTDSGRGLSDQNDVRMRQSGDVTLSSGLHKGVLLKPQKGVLLKPYTDLHHAERNSFHGSKNHRTEVPQYGHTRASFHGSNSHHDDRGVPNRTSSYKHPNTSPRYFTEARGTLHINLDPNSKTQGPGSITSSDSGNVPDWSSPPSLAGTPRRSTHATGERTQHTATQAYTAPILYARCHGTLTKLGETARVHKNTSYHTRRHSGGRGSDVTDASTDAHTGTGYHPSCHADDRPTHDRFTLAEDDDSSSSTSGSYRVDDVDDDIPTLSQCVSGLPLRDIIV